MIACSTGRNPALLAIALAACLAIGCEDFVPLPDAIPADAALLDARDSDAHAADAASTDAGQPDAAVVDSGASDDSVSDASTPDAAVADADQTVTFHTLTVLKQGSGQGVVTSSPIGIDCGLTCAAQFQEGTSVTLTAQSSGMSALSEWSGACTGSGACTVPLLADATVIATFEEPNIVFVTAAEYGGNLGGLAGADAICNTAAQNAGLPGTYLAWLSDDTTDAIDRFSATGARGWIRPDGVPVVDTLADLTAGKLYHPLLIDENGADVTYATIRTGTGWDGRAWLNEDHCDNWTSDTGTGGHNHGLTYAVSSWFTACNRYYDCTRASRLSCWGVDRSVPVATPQTVGRYAFITSNAWAPGGGIAHADAACQAEASAAGLPGSYLALLGMIGASASSRFDTTGLPWVRTDGVAIAPTAALFFSSVVLDSSPNVTADGTTHLFGHGAWSGPATLNTAGTAATTCDNWTSTSEADLALLGWVSYVRAELLFSAMYQSCSVGVQGLLCLQQ